MNFCKAVFIALSIAVWFVCWLSMRLYCCFIPRLHQNHLIKNYFLCQVECLLYMPKEGDSFITLFYILFLFYTAMFVIIYSFKMYICTYVYSCQSCLVSLLPSSVYQIQGSLSSDTTRLNGTRETYYQHHNHTLSPRHSVEEPTVITTTAVIHEEEEEKEEEVKMGNGHRRFNSDTNVVWKVNTVRK